MRSAPAEATLRRTARPAAPTKRASSRLPRLLDEAARAFAQRGFAAASVREIVEPVGMLPGSLYCHFATKEALLAAVYKEGVERIGAAVDAAIEPLADPWQRLEAACVAHLTSLLDQTDYSQVVIRVRPSDAPTPNASAFSPARWITGPSAIGSENGTPSSITSEPAATMACMSSGVMSANGKPAVM